MSKPLLEIKPKELKFTFELKKQSSCSVQLTNNTYQYVAFKVKTTSPKKYSVRPNVGVLLPKSRCDFIVTMQAQKVAPADLVCEDKFLIQSTTVPVETTDEDVTSRMFIKDGSRYVEEYKMKVVLIGPPHSTELSPINGAFSPEHMVTKSADHKMADEKLKAAYAACQVVKDAEQKMANEELQHEKETELKAAYAACQVVKDAEQKMDNEELQHEKETELKPEQVVACQIVKDAEQKMANEELQPEKEMELKPEQAVACQVVKDAECKVVNNELKHGREMELKPEQDLEELKSEKDVGLNTVKDKEEPKPAKKENLEVSKSAEELKLIEVIEEMNIKLNELESKINEAVVTISKLTEERRFNSQEIRILQEKLADLSKIGVRKTKVGFPLLYVCMVALISLFLGYRLHC